MRIIRTSLILLGGMAVPVLHAAEGEKALLGEWKVSLTLAENNQTYHPMLRFAMKGDKIAGIIISGLDGMETELTDLKLEGDKIHFRYTRDYNGAPAKAHYTGTIQGGKMKGTVELELGDQATTAKFTAEKTPAAAGSKPSKAKSLTGKWTITLSGQGNTFSTEMTLKHDGKKLEGTYVSLLDGTDVPISSASVEGDRVRFEVVRMREDQKVFVKYDGKWAGDTIKGKVKFDAGEQSGEGDFEAKRTN